MKRKLIFFTLALALSPLSQLRADSTTDDPTIEPPREVGEAAQDGASTSKRQQIGNALIAISAIAIAVTAIILVSQHEGKRG